MKRIITMFGLMVAVVFATQGLAQQSDDPSMSESRSSEMGMMERAGEMQEGVMDIDFGKLGSADFYLEHSEQLNLTDSQLSRLKNIRDNYQEAMSGPKEQLKTLEGELQNILASDTYDPDNLKDKVREVQEARTNMLISEIEHAAEARDVLNENQRNLAIDLGGEQMNIPSGKMEMPEPGSGMY